MRRHLCFVCLIFVILLLLIMEIFPYEYPYPEDISGLDIQVEGKVIGKEKRAKDGQISYIIYLEQVKPLEKTQKTDTMCGEIIQQINENKIEGIICYMSIDSKIPNLESCVRIQGKMYSFSRPKNPGEFDEALYYKTQGIDLKMYQCNLTHYSAKYSVVKEKLYRFKEWLCSILDRCFTEKYRGIAKAVLLGMKSELEDETKNLYKRNGTLHILCVSGTHISVLGMGLYKLLKKGNLPEIILVTICIGVMVLYGTMIGMGTSVFRAIFMFVLSFIAKLIGRTYDLLTGACVGAIWILIQNPLYLYHSGFLLSFLSVIALGTMENVFSCKPAGHPWLFRRKKAFLSTLYIWIFTLPVYAMYYYEVSLSGLIVNVFVLPFVSCILCLVILVCVLGGIYTPLGIFTAVGCEGIFWCFEKLFELFDSLGKTTLILGKPPVFLCIVFYIGIAVLLLLGDKIKKWLRYSGLFFLCAMFIIKIPNREEITCLDVGQGDCLVIEYKDMVCIVDAGSSSKSDIGTYTLLPFLKHQGIRKVDYLLLSHSDADHINGVEALLEQSKTGVTIERVVLTDTKDLSNYNLIGNMVQAKGIMLCEMKKGDVIKKGEFTLECLGPSPELLKNRGENSNEISMVLYAKYRDFSMLFTGDVEAKGETELTQVLKEKQIREITVLKTAHHGSKNSTGEEFLSYCHPKISFISCGKDNRYGHPHEETLQRLENVGSKIYMTKDKGAIRVKMKKYMEELSKDVL